MKRCRWCAAGVLVLAVAACGDDPSPPATSAVVTSGSWAASGEPAGTQSFADLARNHVTSPVDYPQSPPVGGNHSPAWQNCQFYDTSVPSERAVHSLEHGAVWITYQPSVNAADREMLKALAATGDHILVSEYADQSAPVVATAWGKQLELSGVNDPKLAQFVQLFQQGPQTPEPGVTCRDSTSDTT